MTDESKLSVDNTKQQMRRGILEFCILLIISHGKTYTNTILHELKKANLIVVEGTIYPLLTRLKNAGLLQYDWAESKVGPARKYYSLTSRGKQFLAELTDVWQSLDSSILALMKKFK